MEDMFDHQIAVRRTVEKTKTKNRRVTSFVKVRLKEKKKMSYKRSSWNLFLRYEGILIVTLKRI